MTKRAHYKEYASTNLNVRMKPSVKKMLQDAADQLGISMSEYLEEMIIDELSPPIGEITEEEYKEFKQQAINSISMLQTE